MFGARRRLRKMGQLEPTAVATVRLRTLPTDIDLLGHMNNGRYLSLFDLGRLDLVTRTGMADAMKRNGWYAVVAAGTVTFRKSLRLWQTFDVESRLIGHDERSIFMEHRAVVKGEIYAKLIVRARILKRSGGALSHHELFAEVGRPAGLPDIEPWLSDWSEASRLPSPRAASPSVWT